MLFKQVINSSLNLRTFSKQLSFAKSFSKFSIPAEAKVRHEYRNPKTSDILHNPLPTVIIPVKVLECLLETNSQKINGKNVVDATDSLIKLFNTFKDEDKIMFEKILYSLVNVHKDKIEVTNAVEILKQLMKIRISDSSEVFQLILEIINNLLLDLEFKDYNIVSESLAKIKKKNASTKILHSNLKKKFLVKMSMDFDGNNLDKLTEMFRFATNNLSDKTTFQIIIDSLKNDNFKSIPVENAISIMKSFCTMTPFPHQWHEVLERIQNSLIDNIDQVTINDIQSILFKMSIRLRVDKVDEYYNQSLLDAFANKLISSDICFIDAVACLRSFIASRHVPKKLLSYISAKHFEEKQLNEKKKEIDFAYLERLLCLVSGLALVKYKPIFWEEIQNDLEIPELFKFTHEHLVIYALNLSCLDCYNFELLSQIFQTQYKYEKNPFLHWRLLYLWQHLKINSNCNGPLPSQETIDSFKLLNRMNHLCLLRPNLNEIVGDNKYIKTNMRTKMYHQIDHVLVFDENDKPVTINYNEKPDEYLEDLNVPDNNKIVPVVFLPKWWYFANVDEILGTYSSYLESLQTLNRHVVVIPEKVWFRLPEDSRTDFLRNEIYSKLHSVTNDS